jgi:RNA polymerase sigma factor (TIGR02999 family)
MYAAARSAVRHSEQEGIPVTRTAPAKRLIAPCPSRRPPLAVAPSHDVTQLLLEWRNDKAAAEQLLPIIYEELRRQAGRAMRHEPGDHTLQPTALVHEAYLRLVDQSRVEWRNRAHFFGVAAQMMRRVLVDHARGRLAEKRGGGLQKITLGEEHVGHDNAEVDLLALHDALEALAALDAQQARIVEARYFSGLTIEETAEALGISPATVKRDWAVARAWLRRELNGA